MTEPRTRSWMPPIPAPLQHLFDHFPLRSYPANSLPARSPVPSSSLPTLHIFTTPQAALSGRPSYNPSCLKWQTYLLLNGIPLRLSPSTNHASPTGALPYLSPPNSSTPIPPSRFESYVTNKTGVETSQTPKEEAYQTLLDVGIRAAWLYALYLSPENASLLAELYVHPTSSNALARMAIAHQLRAAAEGEVVRSTAPTTGTGGWRLAVGDTILSRDSLRPSQLDPEQVYRDAEDAFGALASLLGESQTGWFFGNEKPGLFDAAVFAYTCLAGREREGGGLDWGDGGRLGEMVRRAGGGELVRHRGRIWALCYAGKDE